MNCLGVGGLHQLMREAYFTAELTVNLEAVHLRHANTQKHELRGRIRLRFNVSVPATQFTSNRTNCRTIEVDVISQLFRRTTTGFRMTDAADCGVPAQQRFGSFNPLPMPLCARLFQGQVPQDPYPTFAPWETFHSVLLPHDG